MANTDGVKHSGSFNDWDNLRSGETFLANSDAVSNVKQLERDVAAIEQRFSQGELNSFGPAEKEVLLQFQELRRRQVELSRKQVELFSSKKTRGRFGTPEAPGLEQLTEEMHVLCGMIEDVEKMAQEAVLEPSRRRPASARGSQAQTGEGKQDRTSNNNNNGNNNNNNNNNLSNVNNGSNNSSVSNSANFIPQIGDPNNKSSGSTSPSPPSVNAPGSLSPSTAVSPGKLKKTSSSGKARLHKSQKSKELKKGEL
jgi:hypothetical protein